MFRRLKSLAPALALLFGAGVLIPSSPPVHAQEKQQFTGEQVAESVIFVNGTRAGLTQVRRNGLERGRVSRATAEGKTEEATYERRFIRGESLAKDRVRLDQKMPTGEYSLIFADGQVWGLINQTAFAPRQETAKPFLSQHWHSIDTLLRYKENGATPTYNGKEKVMGVDMHVLDLVDKEQRKTRFFISAKTARVLSLEYEEADSPGAAPVKYVRKFYDYRIAQGTWVPFRTVLYRDGKQVEETLISTITYGSKIDEALFKNPDAPATSTAANP